MLLANGVEDEIVLLLSERLNEKGLYMNKEKVMRLIQIISEEKSTPEDMSFVRNNLEGFQTFLYNAATNEFIEAGVPADQVHGLLMPLLEITKMWGASSFADYQVLADLEGN